jgi:hypothetical protein
MSVARWSIDLISTSGIGVLSDELRTVPRSTQTPWAASGVADALKAYPIATAIVTLQSTTTMTFSLQR